jgi:hypothetical protein
VKTCIVVEGHFHAQLLVRLLNTAELPPHVIVEGGGKSDAILLAGSILGVRGIPVALVLDSDTLEPASIAEQQEMREYLLRRGSSPEVMSRIIPAVPQVEAVLFSDHGALACILGRELTEREKIEGEFRPRAVLDRLLADVGMDRDALLEAINPRAAARFAAHPLIQSLARFVEHASAAIAVADAA